MWSTQYNTSARLLKLSVHASWPSVCTSDRAKQVRFTYGTTDVWVKYNIFLLLIINILCTHWRTYILIQAGFNLFCVLLRLHAGYPSIIRNVRPSHLSLSLSCMNVRTYHSRLLRDQTYIQ